MVAVFVVFTSTVEFRISAVYMGRVPLTEHDSIPPCIANRAAGNVTVGGSNWLAIKNVKPLMFIDCAIPAYININRGIDYVKTWL